MTTSTLSLIANFPCVPILLPLDMCKNSLYSLIYPLYAFRLAPLQMSAFPLVVIREVFEMEIMEWRCVLSVGR